MAQQTKHIDAFGHVIADERNNISIPGGEGKFHRYGVELIEGTGNTRPVIKETIDMTELINSYKDQCGMEYMLRLVQTGQISMASLRDDGTGSGDFTGPDNINDAYRAAQAAKVLGDQVAKALGIEKYMDEKDLDALVAKKVAELMEAQKAAAPAEGETK